VINKESSLLKKLTEIAAAQDPNLLGLAGLMTNSRMDFTSDFSHYIIWSKVHGREWQIQDIRRVDIA